MASTTASNPPKTSTRTLISEDKRTPSTSSNNYAEAVAASETGRPGLDRTQSWNRQDQKREQHEQMINSGGKGMGYASTSGGK